MAITSTSIGKTFNLETYLKIRYDGVILQGILPANVVEAMGQDPAALHQQNIGAAPPGAPTSYRDYSYFLFETNTGEKVYLGEPWVNPSTVVEVDNVVYNIRVSNPTPEQLSDIRNYFMAIKLTAFTIDIAR